jgi:hypothetical protein
VDADVLYIDAVLAMEGDASGYAGGRWRYTGGVH